MVIPPVTVFVIVVLGWQYLVGALHVKPYILPKPNAIWHSLILQVQTPSLRHDLWVTVHEALLGYVIAVLGAVVVGSLIAEINLAERILLPYIVAFESVPKIALAPLLLIWFGFGETSKVAMACLISFFAILLSVIEGLRSTAANEVEMMRAFGSNRFQILWKCKVRNALPSFFSGLDIGIIFSLLGAIVGEFVGAKAGLGNRLLTFNYNFDIASMFAVLIILSVIGFTAHSVVRLARRRIVRWSR